jgi:elongation factor Ts
MEITSQMVKELREKTNAGMMDCKKALAETQGDMEKAVDYLRQKGLAVAAKRSGRVTSEGVVECYIHGVGKLGVMVEVGCETDFVAKTDEFKAFAKDVAMHIADANPVAIRHEDMLEQKFVKNSDVSIQDMLNELVAKMGENISVKRFARYQTSEGRIECYVHGVGKLGVMVEVGCETDFVAKTDEFKAFAKDVAMHIAAANPVAIRREDIPQDIVSREREVYISQIKEEEAKTGKAKSENIVGKIVDGKIDKFVAENCLLEQKFVKNPDVSIQDLLTGLIAKMGENISVKRFARFQLGA